MATPAASGLTPAPDPAVASPNPRARQACRLTAWSLASLLALPVPCAAEDLLLATTTSVRDSGLLDALLPAFREETGVRVRVIAVGTGAALRMGRQGNADALLTHAPDAERALVATGHLASRTPFMRNHFVIAGPPEDPAGVAGAASAVDAFRRICASGATYVSRGDDSGTHKRERVLLRGAGIESGHGCRGEISTGAGMGISLQVAGERRAYVLADIGTFLAFRERTGLVSLSGTGTALRNVYSLLRVNGDRFPGRIRGDAARKLEDFLQSSRARELIRAFGAVRFGRPLFTPIDPNPPGDTDG